ncbi:hypothetical protein HGRIS_009133 [Hohenbuehelia grisea]|uniref:Uncharacterized protein n=1 Tax=Hohenbuehelia grisea TaxID=104357 RepID=A0ABR3J083_9AGAR
MSPRLPFGPFTITTGGQVQTCHPRFHKPSCKPAPSPTLAVPQSISTPAPTPPTPPTPKADPALTSSPSPPPPPQSIVTSTVLSTIQMEAPPQQTINSSAAEASQQATIKSAVGGLGSGTSYASDTIAAGPSESSPTPSSLLPPEGDPRSPTSPNDPSNDPAPVSNRSSALSLPAVLAIGSAILLVLVVFAAWLFFRWRRRRQRQLMHAAAQKYLPKSGEDDSASFDSRRASSYLEYRAFHEEMKGQPAWNSNRQATSVGWDEEKGQAYAGLSAVDWLKRQARLSETQTYRTSRDMEDAASLIIPLPDSLPESFVRKAHLPGTSIDITDGGVTDYDADDDYEEASVCTATRISRHGTISTSASTISSTIAFAEPPKPPPLPMPTIPADQGTQSLSTVGQELGLGGGNSPVTPTRY